MPIALFLLIFFFFYRIKYLLCTQDSRLHFMSLHLGYIPPKRATILMQLDGPISNL